MTAAALAGHLHARPAGDGRWLARCPAHADHTPSLAIREGGAGRLLLRCWAGCDTAAVLAAAGLKWSDVMGQPASPADLARQRRERRTCEAADRVARRKRNALADSFREGAAALDVLAARMAAVAWCGAPGDLDALANQHHRLLDAQRNVEVAP